MKLLYFAWVKEKTGTSNEDFTLPDGVATVAQLIDVLKERSSGYSEAFSDHSVLRCAVNQEYVTLEHPVSGDDEIAFFPPVTGG